MKRRNFIKTAALGNAGIIAAPSIFTGWKSAANKMKKIKIGQIGVCHEHASKITSLKKLSDIFEIVGIVDDRNSKAARFAGNNLKPFEGIKWMTEEELFNTPGLEAVMVETANTDLVSTAMRCMEQNLAIHMDKPGGEDLKLFGKLLDGCKERNLPFQMGYMYRNNPAFQFVQKAVRQGWLGDIFEIQAGMSHDYGGADYQRYLSNFKGGIMFNLGCHHIDIVVSFLGRPEKITPFLKSTPGSANGAKNNCRTVIEYPHATVTIHACDREVDGIANRRFKIAGTKGTIEWRPLERFDGKPLIMNLTLREDNSEYSAGSHTVDLGVKLDRYVDQLNEFAKIIRGEMQNPYTYEHDYLAQEVLLAAAGYRKWRK
jgi:predicted dehydrogenase